MAKTMAASVIEMPKRATRTSFKRRTQIAKRIKSVRIAKGITVEMAATRCKVSYWCWQRWEKGEASIPAERLADIASVLGTTEDRILLTSVSSN